jgi:hypothetical protein
MLTSSSTARQNLWGRGRYLATTPVRSRRQLELARAQRRKVLLDRGVAHLLERGGRPARRLGKS